MNLKKEKISILKYVSSSGFFSRRKSVDEIKNGNISVNGHIVIDPNFKVSEEDIIKYKDKKITKKSFIYIVLNKPSGYLTTKKDPTKKKTVMDLIPKKYRSILDPVGRLDYNTTGVLILTNDGDLAYKLSHPKFDTKKTYKIISSRPIKKEIYEQIKKGVSLNDGFVKLDKIFWNEKYPTNITFVLHSGKYRVIRRILETFKIFVKKLHRYDYSSITSKNLPIGKWRFLTEKEIKVLKG